ncbi:MAG: agmatine deiminase family protein [Ignavibacteriales bacterium]|nr:agmatine deiminase family protein [Ignavibacteriales bacterium]
MAKEIKRRIPAEWETHEATILAWPSNTEDWPGKFMPIHWVYSEIVKKLAEEEKVYLLVQDKKQKDFVTRVLEKAHVNAANVSFYILPTDRNWMRDVCPAFSVAKSGKHIIRENIHFKFNGWAKYPNWKKDYKLPGFLSKKLGEPLVTAQYKNTHVVLEGGGIDYNGHGDLLTTEECFLHPSVQVRNPGFDQQDYEAVFKKYLGISNVIWLKNGILGDDTHGHVDDLCRFVAKDKVVLCRDLKNNSDGNYAILEENNERLRGAKISDGSSLEVITLPMPDPLYFDNLRLPASYANFYIANHAVLVPTFNDPMDKIALGILAELFHTRKVVGIHAVDLVWGLGTLHCLTHELPAKITIKNT